MTNSQRLDEDALLAAAEAAVGLTDWGTDQSFRVGLRVLVDALNHSELPPPLMERAQGHVVTLLTQRLGLVEDARQHPDIVAIPVERPLIVIGMPKTRTTMLYHLLASAPDARAPLRWEALNVWPAPEPATWHVDPRIDAVELGIKTMLEASPEITNTIPVGARLPAECNALMTYHFSGSDFGAFYGVAEHSRWVARETVPGLYATHRRLLQQLSWKRPEKRWVLKSPIHLYDLPSLMKAYPDAALVWTHRDPVQLLPSLARLLAATRRSAGLTPDLLELGAETLENYGALLDRGLTARQDPAIDKQILDIARRDIRSSPTDTVRAVHDHFGFAFTEDHSGAVESVLAAHPPDENIQRPEDSGFDEAALRRRFAAYYDRFEHLF